MSLAPVSKIKITLHKKNSDNVIDKLHDLGLVQIEKCLDENYQIQNLPEKISEVEYKLANVKFTLDFLSKFQTEKKSLTKMFNSELMVSRASIENIVEKTNIDQLANQAQTLEQKMNEALVHSEHAEQELNKLEAWKNLNFIPNKNIVDEKYSFTLAIIPTPNIQKLVTLLNQSAALSQTDVVFQNEKDSGVSIVYRVEQAGKVAIALAEVVAKTVELPNLDQTVAERIETLKKQILQSEKTLSELTKEAKILTQVKENLKIVFDHLTWQHQKLLASEKLGQTSQTATIIGWVTKNNLPVVKKSLDKITSAYLIEELEIKTDDNVPVVFQNKWAQPFEAVTMVYGAPQYNEPDPTPFLTPFFTLFFGLAITDAGYGLVMALGIVAAIYLLKIPKPKRKLLWVLFWGGISSMIIGALMGGWFSIDLNTIPGPVGDILRSMVLLNPMEDPLAFFYLSLALGVIQVIAGLGVNSYWKIKHGQWAEALLGSGAWIVTIIALLTWAGSSMNLLSSSIGPIAKWAVWAGLATIVLFKASQKKNFLVGIPMGLLSLYSFVGYFSDVLSYSRLLALGLTTGIIGMVVNIIAGLTLGIPYIGWLVTLVVLVGGHTFNIGINALGAFIHSGRLQYIEFFPKFMEGGGSVFQPFQKDSRYIKVTN